MEKLSIRQLSEFNDYLKEVIKVINDDVYFEIWLLNRHNLNELYEIRNSYLYGLVDEEFNKYVLEKELA